MVWENGISSFSGIIDDEYNKTNHMPTHPEPSDKDYKTGLALNRIGANGPLRNTC